MLKFSNFGKAQIASAPSGTSGLNFTVQAGSGLLFPSLAAGDYFYGIFKDASGNREVVKIIARSTDSLTIDPAGRGLDGTAARTWAAGDYFVAGLTNIALLESLGNANLIALGALTTAADKIAYWTGAGTAALTPITAFIRGLFAANDASAARSTLGAVGLTGNETIAGDKTLSGNLIMSSQSILFASASVAATATASNIWASNRITLTGTAVTFTNFPAAPQAGAWTEVYCNAAHTFTPNANFLIDGLANLTTTPGDRILVRAKTTTVFELHIMRVNGSAREGEIFDWSGPTTPPWGLVCNGAAVSRTTYAALFAAIGTTWGVGDGSTTFNIPNIPTDYTTVMASGNEGTSTVGQVIAHTHTLPITATVTPVTEGGSGNINKNGSTNTGSTGGSANLAAGVRVRKCIRF